MNIETTVNVLLPDTVVVFVNLNRPERQTKKILTNGNC